MGQLNKEQQAAARPTGGHHLVIAGAGTGKTTTLLQKVINLIESEMCRPEEILLLTFSRLAAEELRERLKERVGETSAEKIEAGTFHSFCIRFLREHRMEFLKFSGMDKFPTVMEPGESNLLLDEIIRTDLHSFLGLPVSVITYLVSSDFLPPVIRERISQLGLVDDIANIKNKFVAEKSRRSRIDFSDMMRFTIMLLEQNKKLQNEIKNRYQYILVDEFQDTSKKNFTLLNLLLAENTGLFAVGDDWQSIYGFRDARVEYVVNMKKYFPEVKVHRLTRNYRSHREIVDLSGSFISQNKFRTKKTLKACRGKGGTVSRINVSSWGEEVKALRDFLENSDQVTAVLYRNNWLGRKIQNELPDLFERKISIS